MIMTPQIIQFILKAESAVNMKFEYEKNGNKNKYTSDEMMKLSKVLSENF